MTAPTDAPRVHEVAPGVLMYEQPDGSWMINNTGAVLDPAGVVLVDMTSTEARNRALLAAVTARSGGAPVRTLLNTHHHGDHTFGNWLAGPVTIVGHRLCRSEAIRAELVSSRLFPTDYGHLEVVPPTLTFDDEVVHLPEQGVLFAGDLVFNGGHPFLVEGSLAGFRTALQRLAALDPTVVVPGHGGPGGPGLVATMRHYADWLTAYATDAHGRGLDALTEARAAFGTGEFAPFRDWQEPERLVGNLSRADSELDGAPPGSVLELEPVMADMVAFHGGPLRCFA